MKGLKKNEVRKKEDWEGRKGFDKKKEQRKKALNYKGNKKSVGEVRETLWVYKRLWEENIWEKERKEKPKK